MPSGGGGAFSPPACGRPFGGGSPRRRGGRGRRAPWHPPGWRRGDAFVSPGMRLALRAMIPALLCGAVATSLWPLSGLPQMWILFYGLALLSTAHFAPRSLTGLGWAFLLTGLGFLMVDAQELI